MRSSCFVSVVSLLILSLSMASPAQESRAFFDTPQVVLDWESAPFQRLLDFNDDGHMDAVGHMMRSDGDEISVMVWQNDGFGVLSPDVDSQGVERPEADPACP